MSIRSLLTGVRCAHSGHGLCRLANTAKPATSLFIARGQHHHISGLALPSLRTTPQNGTSFKTSNTLLTTTRTSTPAIPVSAIRSLRFYATGTLPTQNVQPVATTSPIPRHLYSRTRRRVNFQYRSKTSPTSSRPHNGQKTNGNGNGAKAGGATGASTQNKNVLDKLAQVQRYQRPTKEELLAAATGFWSRLRVRFKWFSIRSLRPFNSDEISAFFSWILVGHVIWILVGTTTFFSLLILAVNTVFAQETLAGWVGNYLTKSSGVKVVFESAIVPKWKDGVITFKNVFVSRRPGQHKASVRKGSQTAAAAAAAELASERASAEDEDTNYTQYDLSIETVNVTLSFAKWFNGHGLLRDVEVRGVRGVLDRTAVHYGSEYVDPRTYKHVHDTGDFEIESFKMEDLLVSVYQPDNFRPFSVSIFSADLPRLRKQWLFYDFLSANNISGSFDESLFTIHPRQTHNQTGAQLAEISSDTVSHWKKQSRIRIDGLKIDHLNRSVEGPFSWIHEGNVDIVADVMFPADSDDGIAKVMSDFYDRVEAQINHQRPHPAPTPAGELNAKAGAKAEGDVVNNRSSADTNAHTANPNTTTPHPNPPPDHPPHQAPIILDLSLTLTSVHASIPLLTPHLSYINSALIRPIIFYINSHSSASTPLAHKPFIPITCRVVKPVADFDGAWTVFDSGLMEDLSRETYEAFVRGVGERDKTRRRVRKVGFWVVQGVVQALVLGLAGQIA